MIDSIFIDRDLIRFIYNSYIEGLSVEEIYFRLQLKEEPKNLNFNEIDSIIDDVNLIM
jgi:hypothetical protein